MSGGVSPSRDTPPRPVLDVHPAVHVELGKVWREVAENEVAARFAERRGRRRPGARAGCNVHSGPHLDSAIGIVDKRELSWMSMSSGVVPASYTVGWWIPKRTRMSWVTRPPTGIVTVLGMRLNFPLPDSSCSVSVDTNCPHRRCRSAPSHLYPFLREPPGRVSRAPRLRGRLLLPIVYVSAHSLLSLEVRSSLGVASNRL